MVPAGQDDDDMQWTDSTPKYLKSCSPSNCCCVRYGRTRIICSLSRSYGFFPRTCHIGPHWCCMLMTYCLAVGPAFLFFADELLLGLKVALLASIGLTTVSLTIVACSDPGIVFQNYQVAGGDNETGIVCAQCEVQRPLNASHCSDCGVCVIELDHHCPWTGKCVGKRTIRWFYVFLTFVSLHCMLVGAICLVTFAVR